VGVLNRLRYPAAHAPGKTGEVSRVIMANVSTGRSEYSARGKAGKKGEPQSCILSRMKLIKNNATLLNRSVNPGLTQFYLFHAVTHALVAQLPQYERETAPPYLHTHAHARTPARTAQRGLLTHAHSLKSVQLDEPSIDDQLLSTS
jgi:hypothetical protein